MARAPKPKPIDVFEDNIEDAARLIALARALANTRKRRMRKELREAVGRALKVRKASWDDLDCIESDDVFLVLKANGGIRREQFTESELRPLLRQAVVAIAAAVESYVAEKAACYVGEALKNPTERLKGVSLSLGDVLEIEGRYKRRMWGYRDVVQAHLEAEASPHPTRSERSSPPSESEVSGEESTVTAAYELGLPTLS